MSALLRLVEREGDRNPTSGLPGGHAIEKEIARRVAKADAFAVCYLDLDNFKAFADTFGFATADIVIRGLEQRSAIRPTRSRVKAAAISSATLAVTTSLS